MPAFLALPDEGPFPTRPAFLLQRHFVEVGDGAQPPHRLVDVVDVHPGETRRLRLEDVEQVDLAGGSGAPVLRQGRRRLVPAANLRLEPIGFAIGRGEHLILQQEQRHAGQQREPDERGHRAVQADPAGAQHQQLAVLRHHAHRHERRHQHRHRDDEVDEPRRREREVAEQDQRGGLAAKQLVHHVDERRDVEDGQQPEHAEREHPEVFARDVQVDAAAASAGRGAACGPRANGRVGWSDRSCAVGLSARRPPPHESRDREADRLIAGAKPPGHQADRADAHDDVRRPAPRLPAAAGRPSRQPGRRRAGRS